MGEKTYLTETSKDGRRLKDAVTHLLEDGVHQTTEVRLENEMR